MEFEKRLGLINTHIKYLREDSLKEGYDKGWSEGARNHDEVQRTQGYEKGKDDGYKEGFEAGQKAAESYYRLIVNEENDGGLTDSDLKLIFGSANPVYILQYFHIDKIINSIEDYRNHLKQLEESDSDANLLYSTISDLKADYEDKDIIAALKKAGYEVVKNDK